MAEQPPRNVEMTRSLESCAVNQEQEAELMIRYTKTRTRELAFAIDLMDYVLSLSDLRLPDCIHPGCCERSGLSDLDDQIKRFVELWLREQSKNELVRNVEEIMTRNRLSYNRFKMFLNCTAIIYESWHFREHSWNATPIYWSFCVKSADLCALAFKQGLSNAPHFGIMFMCRMFTNFDKRREFPMNPWICIKSLAYFEKVRLEKGIDST